MAHGRLIAGAGFADAVARSWVRAGAVARVAALAATLALCACAPGNSGEGPRVTSPVNEATAGGTLENSAWGTFHSKRFEASLRLPDGGRWRIDDHRSAWLKADHAPSMSSLWLRSWTEDASATRKLCYARAREWLPSLPEVDAQPLIDDRVRPLFAALDTRVAVGVASATTTVGDTEGFVVASGASAHRCVVVAFLTRARGTGAEDEVAARLVLVSERLLPKVQLDQSLAPSREPAIPSLRGAPGATR